MGLLRLADKEVRVPDRVGRVVDKSGWSFVTHEVYVLFLFDPSPWMWEFVSLPACCRTMNADTGTGQAPRNQPKLRKTEHESEHESEESDFRIPDR